MEITVRRLNPDHFINQRFKVFEEYKAMVDDGISSKDARLLLAKQYFTTYKQVCWAIQCARDNIDPNQRARDRRSREKKHRH